MAEEYVLRMTERQLRCINMAVEEWFRIRLNQWDTVAEDVARGSYVYDKNDPNNSEKFDAFIERKRSTEIVLKAAMDVAQPYRFVNPAPKSPEQLVLEDIWQVIRYELWNEEAKSRNDEELGFGPCKPFFESNEPPLRIEAVEK